MIRARGNRGEVAAIPLSNTPERVRRVLLDEVWFEVEDAWLHRGQVIYKFKGIDSISAAEQLVGSEVCIPLEERPMPPEGEYYQSDLIGCDVLFSDGRLMGKVDHWQEYGGPPLLAVLTPVGKEILIPFAKSICRTIDVAARRIIVELPEGLVDLQDRENV